MTHQLIASPYPEGHVVVRPGYDGAVRIGADRYAELRDAPADALVPAWLAGPVRAGLGMNLAGRLIGETILVRQETAYGYARASYEVNLGCNYACEHCYLGEKMFAGMDWPGRERLLQVMADAGVLWLQLTGGEPLIDPLFAETHAAAWDMGMMIQISSNGSRLDRPKTVALLTTRRPYRLTLSLYGATEASYDGMTRRRGSFRRFMRGLAAAHEAGLAMRINIVVSNRDFRHAADATVDLQDPGGGRAAARDVGHRGRRRRGVGPVTAAVHWHQHPEQAGFLDDPHVLVRHTAELISQVRVRTQERDQRLRTTDQFL
jgi:uncharacterized Fe-S cluster-containing radical SAM superfamily protein